MSSKKFNTVKNYYVKGLWTEEQVRNAVSKKWITQKECEEILNLNE